MCGIVGIVQMDPESPVDGARLVRMRDTLFHRGPDGDGLFVDGPVGLGHRRLAIVDVAGGHQPMPNEDQTVWIVFNGEIYNHAALRPELEAKGHRYRSRSDTETILHLYEEEGDRCVERLQGMFAFAIWDANRNRLLLARDRLGIKPLYYARTDRALLFASEIKAILESGLLRPEFHEAILPEFLATRFVAGEDTFFRGVRKLLPGRTLSWSPAEGFRERRFWRPPVACDEAPVSPGERAADVRDRLAATVRGHLMSDVPLGLFLSGGLDSTGLAALMAPMVTEPIRTFSVGFSEAEANEFSYARLAAHAIGTDHREVVVSPGQFFGALPRLTWHEDEPIAFDSSVPLYFVSRLARDHVKVVLTGEGADELFLGYDYRYRVTALNERLGRTYWKLAPGVVQRQIRRFLTALPQRAARYAGRSFLAFEPGLRNLFFENFAVFPEALQQELIRDKGILTARDPYAEGLRSGREHTGGILEQMSHADLQTYLVELLMKQDQMSMAASIESRVPYLDHRFVEHVASVPGRIRLHRWRTKALLRDALRDLVPREILTRRKMGFPVPMGRWLRGPFWPLVEDLVLGPRAVERKLFHPSALTRLASEHRSGERDHTARLWLLLNLELWQRIFIDGETPAALV